MGDQAQWLWLAVLTIGAIVPIIDAARRWTGKSDARRIEPNPLTVREDHVLQTEPRCAAIHARLDEQFGALREEIREDNREVRKAIAELGQADEARASRVHARIDAVAERCAATDRELQHHVTHHPQGQGRQ